MQEVPPAASWAFSVSVMIDCLLPPLPMLVAPFAELSACLLKSAASKGFTCCASPLLPELLLGRTAQRVAGAKRRCPLTLEQLSRSSVGWWSLSAS